MRLRSQRILSLVVLLTAALSCSKAPHKKLGSALAPPTFRQVSIDPSVVGLAGAVGEIVSGPGGTLAWVKNGVDATDWQAFPGTGGTSSGGGTGEFKGAPLTDANQTLQPGTDTASEYDQPAATPLTAARTKTLGVTSLVSSHLVRIVRKDTGAFNMTIANGGTNAGNLTTALPPATAQYWTAFSSYYNGVDWVAAGLEYLDPIPEPTGDDPAGAITSVTGVVLGTGPGTTSTTFGTSAKATASTAGIVPGIDTWYYSAVQGAQALGLTMWTPAPSLTVAQGYTASPADNGVIGGAISVSAAGTAALYYPQQYLIQNAAGTAWDYKCRFKQGAVSTSGTLYHIGMMSLTGSHRIYLSGATSLAPAAGKWYLELYAGSSVATFDTGVTENTNWNDLEISHSGNGANIIVKLNGTQVVSASPAQLTTGPAIGVLSVSGTGATALLRKYFMAADDSAL
jgi:hypothetical protein